MNFHQRLLWFATLCFAQATQSTLGQVHESSTSNSHVLVTTYRLGFQGRILDNQGLEVLSVRFNGPAMHLRSATDPNLLGALEAGDIITQVDGRPIRSMPDYRAAMDASRATEGRVTLSVIDIATGLTKTWQARAEMVQLWQRSTQLNQPRIRRAHFILIGLTNDPSIGEASSRNLTAVRNLISEEVTSERIAGITVLEKDDCNGEKILRVINQLAIPSTDTLFVYYSGHGAYDPRRVSPTDLSEGHFFQIPTGDLMRRQLWESMVQKRARLTVLITDTCNVESFVREGRAVQEQRTVLRRDHAPFALLLLGHQGAIDISASDKNQYSWFSSNYGGWFTIDACRILRNNNDWSASYQQIRTQVNETFKQRKQDVLAQSAVTGVTKFQLQSQCEMTPRAFVFNIARDDLSLSPLSTVRQATQTVTRFVP